MRLFLKRVLCFVLVFQLSGCAQTVIQQRQERHTSIGEKYTTLETECSANTTSHNVEALEASILCMQERALPMLAEEKFEDSDVAKAAYESQLKAIAEFRERKIPKKKLKSERSALIRKINDIKQSATSELNAREAQSTS